MFTDTVSLTIMAGRGGNGRVSWTRTRLIPKGGPSGGNGGRGGSVYLRVTNDLHSLDHFRNTRIIKGENGGDGGTNQCQGKKGADKTILIPCGTLVRNRATGELIRDCTENNDILELCKGGKGGLGNEHFKSPTNRTPRTATPGKPGETLDIELELKLIADIGFVGLPNAGKSTLLNALTATQVKIGDYPFTTLKPNLSYLEFDDYTRLYLADIPGIIKNAHTGRGLGLAFLKHIERTKILVFVIDLSRETALEDLALLRAELAAHDPALLDKPYLIALNKCDLTEERLSLPNAFHISAKTNQHLEPFIQALRDLRDHTQSTLQTTPLNTSLPHLSPEMPEYCLNTV